MIVVVAKAAQVSAPQVQILDFKRATIDGVTFYFVPSKEYFSPLFQSLKNAQSFDA